MVTFRPHGVKRFRCTQRATGARCTVMYFSALTSRLHLKSTVSKAKGGNTESHQLLAFVLVLAFKPLHLRELPQSISHGIALMNVHAQIQEGIEGVAIVMAFSAGDSRSKLPSEKSVHPRSFGDFVRYFSGMNKSVGSTREAARTYCSPRWAELCMPSMVYRRNSWASSCLYRRKVGAISGERGQSCLLTKAKKTYASERRISPEV